MGYDTGIRKMLNFVVTKYYTARYSENKNLIKGRDYVPSDTSKIISMLTCTCGHRNLSTEAYIFTFYRYSTVTYINLFLSTRQRTMNMTTKIATVSATTPQRAPKIAS